MPVFRRFAVLLFGDRLGDHFGMVFRFGRCVAVPPELDTGYVGRSVRRVDVGARLVLTDRLHRSRNVRGFLLNR